MNAAHIFFLYLKEVKRKIFLLSMVFVLLFFLAGCGGESPVGERLSGPAADEALPIRIDATVTPTLTPTPEADENRSEDPPLTDTIQTPTIAVDEEDSPTPDATPTDSEESTDSETAEDEVLPEPSPVPTPTPTPDERSSSSSEEKIEKPLKKPEKQPKAEKSNNDESAEDDQEEDVPEEIEQEEVESEQSEEQEELPPEDESKEESEVTPVTSTNITLDQLEVCAKVSNRTPVNITEEFSLSEVGKVYTWMRVSGVKPTQVVKHIYYREGKLIAKVSLKLKYTSMRTWSQKTFKPGESVGKWKVVVTTQNEKEVLAVKEFTVVP